ncbi:hypothetical protein KY289_026940 [Solanum tuberosum]|nr:hypothetical protein KY289_026940 [Solanum tuberosum]
MVAANSTSHRQPTTTTIQSIPTKHNGEQPQQNFAATLGRGKKIIRLENKPYELVDGRAKVIFSKEEDVVLAEKCTMTMMGKFYRTRPQIDRLRDEFKRTFPMRDTIKIGEYVWRHVFLDFSKEDDFKRCYSRCSV